MASIKKKSSGGGGANWMDTYGDMVTLLLCFFVLLYSISTIDQQKFLIVMQSFNRNAVINPNEVLPGPTDEPDSSDIGGEQMPSTDQVEQDLEELYEFLAAYAAQVNAVDGEGEILVSQGDDYVFISFADAVFFDGDSYVLRKDGQRMLDGIIPALAQCGPSIDELKVLGHTAQRSPNEPNPSGGDRRLAGSRASTVAAYIQDSIPMEQLHPARVVSVGYGQWRNVSPNDVEANRARNRRVEIVVTGKDLSNALSDSLTQYQTMYETTGATVTTG